MMCVYSFISNRKNACSFSKKFNKFIDEASDRLKSQHQSSVCLVKKERAPNVEPKVNAFSSIGQLISKCDKDIQAILLEWETMYGSCDFELFRGMAESLNKQYVCISNFLLVNYN